MKWREQKSFLSLRERIKVRVGMGGKGIFR